MASINVSGSEEIAMDTNHVSPTISKDNEKLPDNLEGIIISFFCVAEFHSFPSIQIKILKIHYRYV